tara:strand:- start:883 stop:1449 length:567 start_codon:yes stop_codon:yes gene_type:complete
MTTEIENKPSVWIGSWASYNAGDHVGDWFDIDPNLDALEFEAMVKNRLVEIAKKQNISMSEYELLDELDVFDKEYIPDEINVMSRDGYEKITDALKILDPHDFAIWTMLLSNGIEKEPHELRDAYVGCFISTRDFTDGLVEGSVIDPTWSEMAIRYFDWQQWHDDLMQDYGSERCTYCGDIAIYNSWS